MRLFSSTVCCLALAVGVAGADVPASPSIKSAPRPPTATLTTTVRVFPASAGSSHPARIQVKVPRATLQALLQRAERERAATDLAGLAQVTPSSDDAPGSTGALRTVMAACALALAVLLLPVWRRRRRAAVPVVLLVLAAAWSARADIAAPPSQRGGNAEPLPTTPVRGTTQPTPATLELVVTDDGSSGILLTHATPR